MVSIRQRILNQKEPELLPLVLDTAQDITFATAFAALKPILDSVIPVALFPALTIITLYKNYLNWKNYRREVNKSLDKQASMGLNILTSIAEVIAVIISLAVASALVPAIFVGITALNFFSHLGKTVYHGWKCLWTKAGTKKNARHKSELKQNAIATGILGTVGTAMSLLLLAPALGWVVWGAGVGIAAQASAATVIGANALYGGYSIFKMYKQQARLPSTQTEHTNNRRMTGSINSESFIETPQRTRSVSSPISGKMVEEYQKKGCFESLDHDDLEDLNCKLKFADHPQRILLQLLKQERQSLLNDLHVTWVNDQKDGELKLKNGLLPIDQMTFGRTSCFDRMQKQKRLDKLHAVCLLEELVNTGETSLKDKSGNVIQTLDQILMYFDEAKKTENVFKSAFRPVGRMQKLFVLVDEHLDACKKASFSEEKTNGLRI